jgi:CDP-diacylglycerol--glycerol-3-phosphate 3-phosphatidyltransferase/cardiolipin synthase
MLHAKTLVVDGRWVRIGSSNLNLSSLLANYEIDILAEDLPLAHAMEAQFRRDLDRSSEIRYRDSGVRRRHRRPALDAIPSAELRTAPSHRPSLRERRTRTAVALWAVVAGARRTIFLKYTLILATLGILFLFFPRTMAAGFGFLSLWLAVAAWLETGRHPHR